MSKMRVRFYLGAAASAVAMGTSLTLLLAELRGQVLACSVTGGCEAVLSSRFSHLFGVPLGVFGLAGFAWLLALFVLALRFRQLRPLLMVVASGGALIALGLVGLQAFAIHQYCQYCLLIEAMALVILVCAWPNTPKLITRSLDAKYRSKRDSSWLPHGSPSE